MSSKVESMPGWARRTVLAVLETNMYRHRMGFCVGLAWVLGCATTSPGQRVEKASPSVSADLAVELTSEVLARQGIVHMETQSVDEVRPNYFKIRFGLAPRGSGRVLDAYFDGTRLEVVKTEEQKGVGGMLVPSSEPQR